MSKEKNNASRRLGSESDNLDGSETMYSVPTEAGKTESTSPEHQGESEGLLYNYTATIATLSAAFLGTIIVSIIVSRMWDEDEIKLHVLDALIKLLQGIARLCGGWALQCENTYNEYVKALH